MSSTITTSRATTVSLGGSIVGATSSRKKPSSPAALKESRLTSISSGETDQ